MLIRYFGAAAGSWKDENHPDLKDQKDIRAYLKKVREMTGKGIRGL